VIALGFEHGGNDFPDGFLVIDDKNVFDFQGWLPGVNLPSSHYKGQHTDKLGPLPIQKTACSFKR